MKIYAVRLTACLILCCILTLSAPWVLAQEAASVAQDPTPMPVAVSTVAPEVAELTPAAVIPSPLPPELFPQTDLSLAPVYYWQSLQALGLTADDVDVGVVEIDAATGAILSTEFPELSIQLAPLGANGRPLIWRSSRLPDYYWEHMEARGDTAVSVRRYLVQVANEHGRDQLFWPVEAMAVHGLWVNNMGFSQTDEFWEIPGLPDQDDISYDHAVEIAWKAFDAAGGSELDEEVRDALRPGVAFKFSSNVPSNHEWYIQFVDMRYVGLVTQGQVIIDAHTGEVVKVEVVSGNG